MLSFHYMTLFANLPCNCYKIIISHFCRLPVAPTIVNINYIKSTEIFKTYFQTIPVHWALYSSVAVVCVGFVWMCIVNCTPVFIQILFTFSIFITSLHHRVMVDGFKQAKWPLTLCFRIRNKPHNVCHGCKKVHLFIICLTVKNRVMNIADACKFCINNWQ